MRRFCDFVPLVESAIWDVGGVVVTDESEPVRATTDRPARLLKIATKNDIRTQQKHNDNASKCCRYYTGSYLDSTPLTNNTVNK
eukprot:4446102-Pyramimonas_sp.AAC.2